MHQMDLVKCQPFLFSCNSLVVFSQKRKMIKEIPFNLPSSDFAQSVIESLMNSETGEIISIKDCMNSVIEHADKVGTTLQHKIIYLTLHYFDYHSSHDQSHDKEDSYHKNWLIDWFSSAEKLFSKRNNQGNQNYLIQLLFDGDLDTLLQKLKDLKESSREIISTVKPSLCDRIQFVMELVYKKYLSNNCQTLGEFHIYKKQFDNSNRENDLAEKKLLFQNNSVEEITKILQVCSSILLGDEQTIQKISKDNFYLFANLYLLYIGDFSIEELQIQFQKFNKQTLKNETENYLLGLIKQKNYHKIYQSSLSFLHPYFAHFLGSLAFYFVSHTSEILINDEEYRYRIMVNMLEESSKISWKTLFSTAKLYEELENHRKIYYEEISHLLYRYLPYQIITSYEQVHQIRDIFHYLLYINLNQYYLNEYITKLLELNLAYPVSKFLLEIIVLDIVLCCPNEIHTYDFSYFNEGYLLKSNLDYPFDYSILDKLQQLTGENSEIKNQQIKEDFFNYFQSFQRIQEIIMKDNFSQKLTGLEEVMKIDEFAAKGQILRVSQKIIQKYESFTIKEKELRREQLMIFKDALKLFICQMEQRGQTSQEQKELKTILY